MRMTCSLWKCVNLFTPVFSCSWLLSTDIFHVVLKTTIPSRAASDSSSVLVLQYPSLRVLYILSNSMFYFSCDHFWLIHWLIRSVSAHLGVHQVCFETLCFVLTTSQSNHGSHLTATAVLVSHSSMLIWWSNFLRELSRQMNRIELTLMYHQSAMWKIDAVK